MAFFLILFNSPDDHIMIDVLNHNTKTSPEYDNHGMEDNRRLWILLHEWNSTFLTQSMSKRRHSSQDKCFRGSILDGAMLKNGLREFSGPKVKSVGVQVPEDFLNNLHWQLWALLLWRVQESYYKLSDQMKIHRFVYFGRLVQYEIEQKVLAEIL